MKAGDPAKVRDENAKYNVPARECKMTGAPNGSSINPTTRQHLAERDWDKLVSYLVTGAIVPIIGPEALDTSEGGSRGLYDTWGIALAERVLGTGSALNPPQGQSVPLLYWMADRVGEEKARSGEDYSANDLAWDVDCVVRKQSWPTPKCLTQLAEVTTLPLYVSATVDHLLVGAVAEARGVNARQIIFTPHGKKAQADLPEEFPDSMPVVFQLFGATSPVSGTFAKSEDDLIEFSWSLIDHEYAPARLYDYFRTRTVLLLGCNFPDWLGRFFVHALKAGRDAAGPEIYFVSNNVEPGLGQYLRRRHGKIVQQPPASFISELHRRWSEVTPKVLAQQSSESSLEVLRPIRRGAVFISYAREDIKVATRIHDQLEAQGLDTWIDDSGLEPGDQWEDVIDDNIRQSAFFLPIISRSLDPDKWGERRERFLLREWQLALKSNSRRPPKDGFVRPVCIDDTPGDAPFVRQFEGDNWTRLQDGDVPPEFINSLREGIRRFRRTK
jgi:hypothetical protein